MQDHDFAVFASLWNIVQGYETPRVHYQICIWLQNSWERGDRRLLLMAFRACGKSTLVGLFCAWLLWRHPDLRILVLAAETSLATKMVRNVKKIIERHPLTPHLVPEKVGEWASDRFSVTRKKDDRDPSMLAAGIHANVTGCRADIIIYDDVEVPNTCDSIDKRDALRQRLNETTFVLGHDGVQLYVGTPHTYFSIYADAPRREIGEDRKFLSGFSRLVLPVLDKHGQSAWPEKFTVEYIEDLKKQTGPQRFASQMMLEPKNIIEGRLNADLLSFYDGDLRYSEAQRQINLSIAGQKIVSCSAWWDPAFGSATGDHSVLAVVFTDENGGYWLHSLTYIRVHCLQGEDEATLQCQKVAKILHDNFVPSVTVEVNGIGKFLPAILRRELGVGNIPCAVIEHSASKSKNIRILEAFDAVLAARALHVHQSVTKTPFIREMMEWRPDTSFRGHDDGLDAVAGALSREPVRIKRHYGTNPAKFFSGEGAGRAKTDFDV